MKKPNATKVLRKVYEVVCVPPEHAKRKTLQAFEIIGTEMVSHSYPCDNEVRILTIIKDNEDTVFSSEHVWTVRVIDFILPKNDLKVVESKGAVNESEKFTKNSQ